MQSLPIDFTDKKISPWGGIYLFRSVYMKLGLREHLANLGLPIPGSNRGYNPIDVVECFMVSVVLGSKRLAHSGMLRSDEVIREIFGWKQGSPSASTFSRFFQKWDKSINDDIFPALQKRIFSQVSVDKMTVDIDSTVITRHGHQEHAVKGYNPEKRGKPSHHPLIAFCDEMKMVINAWMRTGNSGSTTAIEEFLDELFQIAEPTRIGLLRMDSGYYSQVIMNKLEEMIRPVTYLIKARMTDKLRSVIYSINNWHQSADFNSPYEYSEISYQGQGWKHARRMVICRRKKPLSENSEKQGVLFTDIAKKESYDYYAFVTNSELPCEHIHMLYNKRADCENIIKELKYDYSIDGFALQEFYPMEAAFRLIMLTYNIMMIFKKKIMTSKHRQRLSTIKFQCIALGSYVVKNGRNKMLKLSAEGKRRHFLEKIFDKVEALPPDFQISNA